MTAERRRRHKTRRRTYNRLVDDWRRGAKCHATRTRADALRLRRARLAGS